MMRTVLNNKTFLNTSIKHSSCSILERCRVAIKLWQPLVVCYNYKFKMTSSNKPCYTYLNQFYKIFFSNAVPLVFYTDNNSEDLSFIYTDYQTNSKQNKFSLAPIVWIYAFIHTWNSVLMCSAYIYIAHHTHNFTSPSYDKFIFTHNTLTVLFGFVSISIVHSNVCFNCVFYII